MSENKFIKHLRGKGTAKSVLEVKNQNTPTSFANMPDGSSNANDTYSDYRGNATSVLKGTENWKLDTATLVESATVYGDGRDMTGSYDANGSTLWVDATATFSASRRYSPNTKFVLKLCGNNLLSATEETIDFTLLVNIGTTTVTKTFTIAEQANFFCKEFVIDFSESNGNTIKIAQNDTINVQLLCGDPNASATIYNGMTVFTALQRRVDADAVSSDTRTLDELEEDFEEFMSDTETALNGKVSKTGDTMTGALNIADIASSNAPLLTLTHSSTATYKWNIAPRYNSTTLSVYPGSTETNGFRFATTGFVPASNNARYLGSASLKWKGIYVGVINNGADLTVPNKTGTLATMGDVELAARSGRMLTDQGVWYAKMYAATVVPTGAEYDGKNYADFSQVDADNNPIIKIYTGASGAWTLSETITPPAEYDGYVPITSKIWDIAEQAGQQGGRVLWNHQSKEFTPYPQIISFENIGITGNSTVVMPQNPGANQIVNKDYVDEAIAAIPTPAVDVLLSPDIKIVGSLTQNGSVFSEFSSGNYLRSRWSPVDFREPFEFVIGANITAGTLNQMIVSHGPTAYNGIFNLLYKGSTGELMFRGGGGTIEISGVVSTGVDYLIKVTWDGTEYKMFVSTDNGATYSQVGSTYTSTTNCGYGTYLQIGKDGGTQFYESFLGTINLAGAYLKIGEEIIWSGMDAPGLGLRVIKGHEVIDFQAPTSQNNYTWYRKYRDGWVEQGGTMRASTRGERTTAQVNLPITMSDNNYYVNCQKVGSNDGASVAIQVVDRDSTYFNWCVTYGSSALDRTIVWEVCGMAA